MTPIAMDETERLRLPAIASGIASIGIKRHVNALATRAFNSDSMRSAVRCEEAVSIAANNSGHVNSDSIQPRGLYEPRNFLSIGQSRFLNEIRAS